MYVDRADVCVCGLSGVWSVCLTGSIMCSSYVKLRENTRMCCFLLVNSAVESLWLNVWFLRQRSGTRPTLSCLPVSRGTSFECPRTAVWPTHNPAPAKLFNVFVRVFFIATVWALLPCQFIWLNAGLCCRLFASQRRRVRTVGAGRRKSTTFLTVDLIRITRPVHRRSAVNCNLRRPSCRGRIHGLVLQHLKTTQVIKET